MVATLNVNPMQTTNAAGTFRKLSDGFIQGIAMDDPAIRNALAGGVLSSDETLPMWGGVGISELIAALPTSSNHVEELGNNIRRATGLASALALTGFSVFDQNHSALITPQSTVPLVLANMTLNFYRLGSGARIPVKMAPQLISARGGLITQQVSWDFVGQQLVPYAAAYNSNVISGAVWASTGGGQVTFTVADDLTAAINAGDQISVSGVVNTGGANAGVFNGSFKVKSITSSTIVVEYLASGSPGTYASGGLVAAGGGALPVKVLAIKADNCLTVNYSDPAATPAGSGFATWDYNGACALIQI